VETFTNNEDGTLTGSAGGSGTVNYITGDVELTFFAMVASNPITATYEYFANVPDTCYLFATSLSSSSLGTATRRVTLPPLTDMDYGDYGIMAYDGEGNHDEVSFAVGAVITVDIDAAPSGAVIEVRGRGFDGTAAPGGDTINAGEIFLAGTGSDTDVYIIDVGTGIHVDADGEFKVESSYPV